jgi:hypothetical protein
MTNPAGRRQREIWPLVKRPLLEGDGGRTMERIGQVGDGRKVNCLFASYGCAAVDAYNRNPR